MRQNDVVTLIVGNSALPHTVTATEVGQSLTFTLSRDLVGSNGDGGVVLYYTIRDEVGNRATDHSLSVSVMIQTGSAAPIPPTVTGIGEQNTLYLSQLGSQSVIVSLDTRAFRPGDVLTLFWMGLDRTGMPTSLTEVQTLKSQTTLDFTIANAVIQTLAGGAPEYFLPAPTPRAASSNYRPRKFSLSVTRAGSAPRMRHRIRRRLAVSLRLLKTAS